MNVDVFVMFQNTSILILCVRVFKFLAKKSPFKKILCSLLNLLLQIC